jgi:hypothetical protein
VTASVTTVLLAEVDAAGVAVVMAAAAAVVVSENITVRVDAMNKGSRR